MQDLFGNTPIDICLDESQATLFKDFLDPQHGDAVLEKLQADTPWKQDKINFMGKVNPVPRLAAWYSKDKKSYFYSGIKVIANPYTTLITDLNDMAENLTGHIFNSVLVNLYRDGNDSVSWHADDEKSLGSTINIASLTLGVERDFQLKRKDGNSSTINIKLPHGSLLSMGNPTQQNWLHQIPKRKNVKNPRINLTFRYLP